MPTCWYRHVICKSLTKFSLFEFWFCLPMDWDFSSLPWDESFLKGGSHFLAQGNSVCHLYLFSLHVMISLHNWFEKNSQNIRSESLYFLSLQEMISVQKILQWFFLKIFNRKTCFLHSISKYPFDYIKILLITKCNA